jgi:hypothetical protein
MHRVLFLLAAVGGITGCASADATYTIAAATAEDANARAARYCSLRNATARLEGVEQRGGKAVDVYRCVPGQAPARQLEETL